VEWLEKIECRALVVFGYREMGSGSTRYSRLSKHRPLQCQNKHSITFFLLCLNRIPIPSWLDYHRLFFGNGSVTRNCHCNKISIQETCAFAYPAAQRIINWCHSKCLISFWSWLKLDRCVDIGCELWVSKKQ